MKRHVKSNSHNWPLNKYVKPYIIIRLLLFSHLVMSNSLRPHGLHHARLPCPSLHFMGMPSNHLLLCCPLLFLSSIFPSIKVYSNKLALRMRWPKYCSFSFSIIPSKEHPGLISFRMDWLCLGFLIFWGQINSFIEFLCCKNSWN